MLQENYICTTYATGLSTKQNNSVDGNILQYSTNIIIIKKDKPSSTKQTIKHSDNYATLFHTTYVL